MESQETTNQAAIEGSIQIAKLREQFADNATIIAQYDINIDLIK